MNKFKFYFIALLSLISFFSCDKDENTIQTIPLKDYTEQYGIEADMIKSYLESHYITVINEPGKTEDQDVIITKIPDEGTQPSIISYLNNTGDTYPQLKTRAVKLHNVDYTLYYLVLREGTKNTTTNRGGDSPWNTDSVLASYSGSYLKSTTENGKETVSATFFEESKYPSQFFNLMNVIRGWSEVFPQFKTGWYEGNEEDGSISFYDFGAGVMFVPSGLAYYNSSSGSIPSYSPLVFSFKLYEIARNDSDGDGLYNYQEDIKKDGYMYSFLNTINYPNYPNEEEKYGWFADDSDRDEIPNFLDIDDDDDGYSTKLEREKGTDYLDETKYPN